MHIMKLLVAVLFLFCWQTLAADSGQEDVGQHSLKEFVQTGPAKDQKGNIQQVVSDKDGVSYDNSQQINITNGCPVICFRADPVCGVNGATFWCGMKDAKCNGVEVAHVGYCSLGNGGAAGRGFMAGQALLLVHTVWLILAGILVIFGQP